MPPDAVILIHDDGAPAEGNRNRMVDVVGLKTPWTTDYHTRLTLPSLGARKGEAVDLIARRAKADFVAAFHDDELFWYPTATDLAKAGWGLTLVRPREVENGYDVFKLTPPP